MLDFYNTRLEYHGCFFPTNYYVKKNILYKRQPNVDKARNTWYLKALVVLSKERLCAELPLKMCENKTNLH